MTLSHKCSKSIMVIYIALTEILLFTCLLAIV